MRVGIVGAGIAGLVTAWLLDQTCTGVVLEARSRIGGNARSVTGRIGGVTRTLDLGTQELAADGYPLHLALLTALGFGERELADVPSSYTILSDVGSPPLLVGRHPGRPDSIGRGPGWEPFQLFQECVAEPPAWDVPFGSIVEPLPVSPDIKQRVLYALPASLFGCAVSEAPALSAHAASEYFLGVAGDTVGQVRILRPGMESLAWALAGQLSTFDIRTNCPIHQISRGGGGYELHDSTGHTHAVDCVVLAASPPDTMRLLPGSMTSPGNPLQVLHEFTFRPLSYALHLDPVYLPDDRSLWSTTNLTSRDGWAETSMWCGPTHGIDIFKSQITHRARLPQRILASSTFHTFLPTPAALRAQRTLAEHQGKDELYFAGHYTTGAGSQEDAVQSAVDVARRLSPDSFRLRTLDGDLNHRKESRV